MSDPVRTSENGPALTTGQPAKDSGGGMIWANLIENSRVLRRINEQYDWHRYTQTREYRRAYARHWELEGPHA